MADNIQATPQNQFLGLLSGGLSSLNQGLSNPFGYQNPPGQMISNLFGIPALQRTVERMSYGEPLTTGQGMTTQVRPDTLEAALAVAPALAGMARGVKAVPAMINEMRSTPLPLEWYHGTSPEGAQAIRQSGQFNPNAGKRTYEYSELGPNTVYFAPEGSWWLDPTKAEAGRAMSYKDQVSMRLSKDANVKVIDSPAQFDKIAKSVGYKDGKELRDALWADNLGIRKEAEQVRQGTFEDFLTNRLNDFKRADPTVNTLSDAAQRYGMSPEDWLNLQKEGYAEFVNFESQYEKANKATQDLLKKGIDGLYFSPKFADKAYKQEYMGTVAGDQLGIFRPEIAKVIDNPSMSMPTNPAYKDPFADTTR